MRASLRLAAIGLIAGLGWLAAQAADPPSRLPRPDADASRTAMRTAHEKGAVLQDRAERGSPYYVLFLEYWEKSDCERACKTFQDPVYVFDRLDEFATVLVKVQERAKDTDAAIGKVLDSDGLRWYDDVGMAQIPPPRAQQLGAGRGEMPPPIVHGGARGFTGKGVLIAVVDSGIDFRHPDFIAPDGSSRIAYYWDTLVAPRPSQGQPGPRNYFSGGPPIGTLYTRDDLTRYLKSGDKDEGPVDEGGHGTGCAGVAAGNGSVWQQAAKNNPELLKQDCRGVAPEADLVAVRIGRDHSLPNAWMLNAIVAWLDEMAGDRPLVISCSFGGQDGGHDASLIEERELARRLPANRKGRAICIAAGNEATDQIHVSETFSKDRPGKIEWQSRSHKSSDGRFPESLQIFIDGAKVNDVEIALGEGTEGKLLRPFIHGVSNARVQVVATAGNGSLTLTAKGDGRFRADCYFSTRDDGEGPMGRLVRASNTSQVGTPATTTSAITVGSYDFNDMLYEPDGNWYSYKAATGEKMKIGAISAYSNGGFLRSTAGGRAIVKPDLAAPGQWHVAPACPASVKRWEARKCGLDATRRYALFNGTSAATPYTAGVIALLMQKNPRLSADDFRTLVRQHASSDDVGTVPNRQWGYGKLDLKAVEAMLDAWR